MVANHEIDKEIRHHALLANATEKATIDVVHSHLDVVDTKTSVLLTFNGLMITVFAVLIGITDIANALPNINNWKIPIMLSAILIVLSTLICLAGLVIIGPHDERDDTENEYMRFAAEVSVSRTWRYIWALRLSGVGCFVICLAFLFSVEHVFN